MAGARAQAERPLAAQTYRDQVAAVEAGFRQDPRIGELIGHARQLLAADPAPADMADLFHEAITAAGALLSRTKAGAVLPRADCERIAYAYATTVFPRADDGSPLPVEREVRLAGIPGIDGRPLWVLQGPPDVAAMRDALAPGQVWVRADLLRSGDWPTVRAIANDAAERMLHKTRRPGRRPGSRNAKRELLLEQIRARPEMSTDEVDALGVDLGVWEDALGDYTVTQSRVRRARRDAVNQTLGV